MKVELRETDTGSFRLLMNEGRQRSLLYLNDLEGAMEINRLLTQEIVRIKKSKKI